MPSFFLSFQMGSFATRKYQQPNCCVPHRVRAAPTRAEAAPRHVSPWRRRPPAHGAVAYIRPKTKTRPTCPWMHCGLAQCIGRPHGQRPHGANGSVVACERVPRRVASGSSFRGVAWRAWRCPVSPRGPRAPRCSPGSTSQLRQHAPPAVEMLKLASPHSVSLLLLPLLPPSVHLAALPSVYLHPAGVLGACLHKQFRLLLLLLASWQQLPRCRTGRPLLL